MLWPKNVLLSYESHITKKVEGPTLELASLLCVLLPLTRETLFVTYNCQDAFDHNKGQKSAITEISPSEVSIFSSVFFSPLSPGFLSNLAGRSPQIVDKIARFPGREES